MIQHPRLSVVIAIGCLAPVAFTHAARAGDLILRLPRDLQAKSATATAAGPKVDVVGKVDGNTVSFANVLPDTPYDVTLTLADGTVLRGVDLSWYNGEAAAADAGELTGDDQEQVRTIVQGAQDFYNKKDVLAVRGDHDRAAALVRLVRDTDFHSGKGEIVWRVEVWYFRNEAGGWAIVRQQNRVLRRERFKTAEAYNAGTASLRWVPGLGGLRVPKAEGTRTIALSDAALAPVSDPREKVVEGAK